MFSNKKSVHNRSSRLQANPSVHPRSSTPQHNKSQGPNRVSQSQAKPQHSIPISNPVSKLTPITEQLTIQKPYYLGRGNNHQVIKKVIQRRKGWGEVSSNTEFVYFRWVQSSYSFKFHLLGKQCYSFNHFEYHRELSNKQRLVSNLINFCEANKINVYSFVPVCFTIDLNTGEEDLALHAFMKFFNRHYPDQSVSRRYQTVILPRSKYLPYLTAQQLNKRSQGNFYCKPFCPKSFLDNQNKPYLWILKPTFLNRGRGVVLFKQLEELEKTIWKYYEGQGLEDFSDKFSGSSTVIKIQQTSTNTLMTQSNIQAQDLVKQEEKQEDKEKKQKKSQQKQQKQQIKKEEIDLKNKEQTGKKQNKIESNLPSLVKLDSSKSEPHSMNKSLTTNSNFKKAEEDGSSSLAPNSPTKQQQTARCMSFIIQKYIQRPMLIEGKKFDIRVWALLTQNMEVFVFQEAYLRFSSQLYSTKDNHTNPFVHLTNNSVQKYSEAYDKGSGNQESLSCLVNYLPPNKVQSIYKSIVSKIKEIVWLSMCSARRKININSRKQCFQLFGYDFMIDCEYKVWLIQVNTNPAIEEASPLLRQLIPRMIDDMFKLTIDKIFNNKMKDDLEPFPVEGFKDDQNMWEFLGDLREGANEKNGRRLTFARR